MVRSQTFIDRRSFAVRLLQLASIPTACGAVMSGCVEPLSSSPERGNSATSGKDKQAVQKVWGQLGLADGRFQKPRAMTIDEKDQLYIVDKTGRIQVFDRDGNFLRKWRTPEIFNGKPTGLGIDRDGDIMVADTHYFRILYYSKLGEMRPAKTLGGSFGPEEGQFAFATDALQDDHGDYYTSEYGEYDRIQKYDSTGKFLYRLGTTGEGNLQFSRPQCLAFDSQKHLVVSDACNHRIHVLKCLNDRLETVRVFGSVGKKLGQFQYPYGIHIDRSDNLYVAEFGNHRIQKLTMTGEPIDSWGSIGKAVGQLDQPWAITKDSRGALHILDTGNNRVQRVDF